MTEELEALAEDITAQHANPPEFCTCEKCHDKQIERIRIVAYGAPVQVPDVRKVLGPPRRCEVPGSLTPNPKWRDYHGYQPGR